MIQTIRKAWGIPELRKKIIFTLLILLIFRLGNAIMVPYINRDALALQMQVWGTGLLGLYNVMSGGAFATATVFALSIQPYINSSIIIQLLTVAIPALERLARDGGEEGKKKIQSITRYATVAIAILQAIGYYFMMKNYNLLEQDGIWVALVIIVTLIAGSSFVMWMGEQVTEFGVGNGISIILFAGILARIPYYGFRHEGRHPEMVRHQRRHSDCGDPDLCRLHRGTGAGLPERRAGSLEHCAAGHRYAGSDRIHCLYQ